MSEDDRKRSAAIFDEAARFAEQLQRKGFTQSEIASNLASFFIASGVRIDGPWAWAGALRDHASRVEKFAAHIDGGMPPVSEARH